MGCDSGGVMVFVAGGKAVGGGIRLGGVGAAVAFAEAVCEVLRCVCEAELPIWGV